MKTLLAITTLNQVKYTKIADRSIPDIDHLDVLYIDDKSNDNTVEYLTSNSRRVITKNEGCGLTDSWNIAYRVFKNERYSNLFISNNDVILNRLSIERMIEALKYNTVVCPLSSKHGSGHNYKYQDIGIYYPHLSSIASIEADQHKIPEMLNKSDVIEMERFNGFFFGVNTGIIKSQYDVNNLFDPSNQQCGQESDLERRLLNKPVLCCNSFIFHYKGITCPNIGVDENGKDLRNNPEIIRGYHA